MCGQPFDFRFQLESIRLDAEIRVMAVAKKPRQQPKDHTSPVLWGGSPVAWDCGKNEAKRHRFEAWTNHKLDELQDWSLNRSEIYHELLFLLNSGRIELLDDERANHQLLSLEHRTTALGKDTLDHPKSGKDDRINSIAGCAVTAANYRALIITQEMLAVSRHPRQHLGNDAEPDRSSHRSPF